MSEPNQATHPAQAQGEKKPYEKPAIAWEEPLEVRPNLMAGCIKIVGEQGACESAEGS